MAKAKRLSVDQLENIRMHMLEHGGVLFKRMCPRQTCHSVVVLHKDAVVCLTCGWHGPGGWAAILWSQGSEMEIAGGEPNTTNNRMEPILGVD